MMAKNLTNPTKRTLRRWIIGVVIIVIILIAMLPRSSPSKLTSDDTFEETSPPTFKPTQRQEPPQIHTLRPVAKPESSSKVSSPQVDSPSSVEPAPASLLEAECSCHINSGVIIPWRSCELVEDLLKAGRLFPDVGDCSAFCVAETILQLMPHELMNDFLTTNELSFFRALADAIRWTASNSRPSSTPVVVDLANSESGVSIFLRMAMNAYGAHQQRLIVWRSKPDKDTFHRWCARGQSDEATAPPPYVSWFDGTWNRLRRQLIKNRRSISLLRISTPFFNETMLALEEFFDLIEVGGYVVFDKWRWNHVNYEAQQAVVDFLESNALSDHFLERIEPGARLRKLRPLNRTHVRSTTLRGETEWRKLRQSWELRHNATLFCPSPSGAGRLSTLLADEEQWLPPERRLPFGTSHPFYNTIYFPNWEQILPPALHSWRVALALEVFSVRGAPRNCEVKLKAGSYCATCSPMAKSARGVLPAVEVCDKSALAVRKILRDENLDLSTRSRPPTACPTCCPVDFNATAYVLLSPDVFTSRDLDNKLLCSHYVLEGCHERRLYGLPLDFDGEVFFRLNPQIEVPENLFLRPTFRASSRREFAELYFLEHGRANNLWYRPMGYNLRQPACL